MARPAPALRGSREATQWPRLSRQERPAGPRALLVRPAFPMSRGPTEGSMPSRPMAVRALPRRQVRLPRHRALFPLRRSPILGRPAAISGRAFSGCSRMPARPSRRATSRAAQDYSQALALDPGNPTARAGLGRANAAFGAGDYAQAVGAGFAALGAGRLEEAQADFQRARGLDPRGREAEQGLNRVAAALRIRKAADMRYRTRADLEYRLEALVNDPQQLDSPAVRAEAASLIREADAMSSSGGTVLRSLAVRLAILLPAYDKPVHLALVSDNLTEVAIPQIGSFGTFARREIDLKPGRYTVIGTRAGYREVRRNVTVVPGQNVQTISVRCDEPIGAAAPPRADDKLRRP